MDKYYYLIASLPLLKFMEPPGIARQDFIAQTEKWLCTEDFMVLNEADINNFLHHSKDTPLLSRWKDFEYSTRTELASYRRAKRQDTEYKIRKDLSNIIQESSNPLEIETKLSRLKWDLLEEQEIGHFFDLDFLIIYYLKLQILERLTNFNKEKGKQNLEVYSWVEL
ncbi:MAG: DUF2764 domain-containing protein [Candidatus Omnitrophica bacterium]|nr:DUF2764 domain-containing protein [Candidatus Omnitrophota bacterium]